MQNLVSQRRSLFRGAFAALLAVCAAALPASAAEPVPWPLQWRVGDTWTYEFEDTSEQSHGLGRNALRMTWTQEIRIDKADADGYTQRWSSRDARIETVAGEPGVGDALASTMAELEKIPLIVELDAQAKPRRVRNFAAVQAASREAMTPAMRTVMFDTVGKRAASLDRQQRDGLKRLLEDQLNAAIDRMLERKAFEAGLLEPVRQFSRFVGQTLRTGAAERRRDTLYTPTFHAPLQAIVAYDVDLPQGRPELARVRWTSDLLTDVDAAGQWALAEELSDRPVPPSARSGRPADLKMQQRGFAVFRREDGMLLLLEATTDMRYGNHTQNERRRARLAGSDLSWEAFSDEARAAKPGKRKGR